MFFKKNIINNKKPNLLFIKIGKNSTFIENDEKILKKHFNVISFDLKDEKKYNRKIFRILKNEKIDLIYIWFALYYFAPIILFSKFFGKKTIVIAGGYDVACIPETSKQY